MYHCASHYTPDETFERVTFAILNSITQLKLMTKPLLESRNKVLKVTQIGKIYLNQTELKELSRKPSQQSLN